MRDAVAEGARAHPGRLALDARDGGWSYRDLDAAADRLARRLTALGVGPGDTVGMLAPTGPAAVAAMYAAPRAGAALAPLNPAMARREVEEAFALARPAVVLCDPAHLELVRDAAVEAGGEGKCRVFTLEDPVSAPESPVSTPEDRPRVAPPDSPVVLPENSVALPGDRSRGLRRPTPPGIRRIAPSAGPLPGRGPDDVVAILRTSGTGGAARAVALTRRNFDASARAVRARLGLCPDDVWHASLSLAHIGGMALVDRALAAGSRVVVRGAYQTDVLARLLAAGRVSHVSLVPTMLGRLLDAGLPRPLPATLRCVLVGGAGAPPALVERALAAGLPVALTYGMTETCSQVATAPPALVRAKPGTAGPPLDGVEVRIAADGEIEVRGETVARGYITAPRPPEESGDRPARARAPHPAAPAHPLAGPDGWYRTGDLGRLDRDGHLWVTGRKANRIVSGGTTVDPAGVERVLAAHPAVAEAAVAGLPDPEWGERVAAAVVPAPGHEVRPEALLRHCRELLGPAARPRSLVVLNTLPRNPNGKIDRVRLAALLSGGDPGKDIVA